jgi:Virulence factor
LTSDVDVNWYGYHPPAVAEYRITSWREIPTMVTARDGAGATAKAALPDRFQEAVDEAAMRQGLIGSDAYLEGWGQGPWQPADGSPDEVASRVAAELDAANPPERLAALLDG